MTRGVVVEPACPEVTMPDARPSQILRSLPRHRWDKGKIHRVAEDGKITHCAIGRLADEGGFDWLSWDRHNSEFSNAAVFVRKVYGLKFNQVTAIMLRNDRDGLDSAIEFLEKRGL